MSYAKLLKFGTATFPTGTSVANIERGRSLGTQKLARQTGARQLTAYRNGIRVTLRVPIVKGPFDSTAIRSTMDTVRSALAQGPANLYLYDDRYYRCCEALTEVDTFTETTWQRIDQYEAVLIGPDDALHWTGADSQNWSTTTTGTTVDHENSGNTWAYPAWSFTVGGSGTVALDFSLTNLSTGEEAMRLYGSVTGGDVISVRALSPQAVTISGSSRMDLMYGSFIRLQPGTNNIMLTVTSGTLSAISPTWADRFL